MPASSATIGCNIAALRVKVTGLAPCLLVRSQKHPVYSTVLRHRIHRSTSAGLRGRPDRKGRLLFAMEKHLGRPAVARSRLWCLS